MDLLRNVIKLGCWISICDFPLYQFEQLPRRSGQFECNNDPQLISDFVPSCPSKALHLVDQAREECDV